MDRKKLAAFALLSAIFLVYSPPEARAEQVWQLPLAHPKLMHEYVQPVSDYGAGHRGVDYLAEDGLEVFAASDGEVFFTGRVVDRFIVTLSHPGSTKTSYEPVCSDLNLGDEVAAGEVIGKVCSYPGYKSHCGALTCLHFSMRRSGGYLSPLAVIGGLAPSRLIPVQALG
ncbi:MAG: hypothetical protein RLZ71_207 [Actinomycetota bacterium]|jgi:murein DD-endopeptidase MepM/ murein hydrolase activator NlpD